MSNPPGAAKNHGEAEKTMSKTAPFVVFSGTVISILRSLNPFNSSNQRKYTPKTELTETPPREQHFQIPVTTHVEQNVVESTTRVVEIVKGDTLWSLSRKYGVSINAIKEANGLTSDTIYARKKLNIPY